MTTPVLEQHDFARPWAKRRRMIYTACVAASTLFVAGVVIGVGVGAIPMTPEVGVVACFLFTTPIVIVFITSWIDVPGEKRTMLERANEFQMIWFVAAAVGSELWWELPWLVGDSLGLMHLTDKDKWGFAWWYYGVADTRYLTSDGALFGMEVVAVGGACILLAAWFKLRKAGNDPAKRIKPLWWSFFTMSMMLTVFFVYYLAEVRHGFSDFPRRGFWDITIVLIYENLPWLIAPIVSLPFVAQQLGYLYRKSAITAMQATAVDQPSTHAKV